jgi:hypothetical protein
LLEYVNYRAQRVLAVSVIVKPVSPLAMERVEGGIYSK